MDPNDPRARRVAAAARSPFPALRKYAQEALAEGAPDDEQGYFTDPDQHPSEPYEQHLSVKHDADLLRKYTAARFPVQPATYGHDHEEPAYGGYGGNGAHDAYDPPGYAEHDYQADHAPDHEQQAFAPPPSSAAQMQLPPPVTQAPPYVTAAAFDESGPDRPVRQDLLLGTAVAFLAFVLIRPLVPAPRPAPPPSVTPWQMSDRTGGTLEATVGAPVTGLTLDPSELAVEIPLADAPTAVASPASPYSAVVTPAEASPFTTAALEAPPAPAASVAAPAPHKRVGVWLTVQTPAELAQIYTALSRHHLERENWDQARYYADKVLGTWPDNADARRLREAARKGLGVGP